MAGLVISGQGVTDRVGIGDVVDGLGAISRGGDGDNSRGARQECTDCTSKSATVQVTTAAGHGVEDHPVRLGVGDGDAGDGDAGGVAHG